MKNSFKHFFEILPEAQQIIWPELKSLRNDFVLYGGTAIALRFGHRQSIDFDFFSEKPLKHKNIVESLPLIRNAEILQSEKNTYTVMIPVEDDYVKISFFGGIDFGRVGVPELTGDGNLYIASLQDLLATKLKVLMQRVEQKDYIDIAALLSHGLSLGIGLASSIALFGKVFSIGDCLRALEYFDDPNLEKLEDSDKLVIQNAVKDFLTAESIPKVNIRSVSLSI